MTSTLSHVKRAIYNFKHRYGFPIDYHYLTSATTDPVTGDKVLVHGVNHVKKAVVLRTREFRSFVYDLAYISANKDFTEGGFFDPEDRTVLTSLPDLGGRKPTVDDYIVFQNARYDVSEIFEFEANSMLAFNTRKLRGQEVTRMVSRHSGLVLTDTASVFIVDGLTRNVVDDLALTDQVVENP